MVNTTLPKPSTGTDSDSHHGLYLYGIIPENKILKLDCLGLDKQPVYTHTVDQFVFLYSIAHRDRYLASRKNLLGHERVLEHVMSIGCRNALPLRFGLVIESWDTVYEQLIASHRDGLMQLFDKLDNRREVSVKVMWDMSAELEMLMQENDGLRQERDRLEGKTLSMEEIVAIGQSIEQAMDDRRQAIIETFQSILDADAVDVIENDPMTDAMIYNAAYLIDWDSEAEFSEKVDALDTQFDGRLRIRYNNFTAPFNFAQIDRD